MMSQPKIVNAGQVENYHKKKSLQDNYFNEGSGNWSGKFAEKQGLSGNINDKDFSEQIKNNERIRNYEFKISLNKNLSKLIMNNESIKNEISESFFNEISSYIKKNEKLDSKYTDQNNQFLKIISLKNKTNINISKSTGKIYFSINSNKVHSTNWDIVYKQFNKKEFKDSILKNVNRVLTKNSIQFTNDSFKFTTITHRGRIGFDIVSSVPKSCSIAMWRNKKYYKDITNSMMLANSEVLKFIENELIQVRVSKNNIKYSQNSENMVCASFPHYQSRNEDPYFHIHNIIFNSSYDKDGNLKTISNELLFEKQSLLRHMHSNIFYKDMVKKGYTFRITDHKKNIFELSEVPDELIKYFSKSSNNLNKEFSEKNLDKKKKGLIDHTLNKIKPKKSYTSLDILVPSWTDDMETKFNFTENSLSINKENFKELSRNLSSKQKLFFEKLDKRLNNNFYFFTENEYIEFCLAEGTSLLIDYNFITQRLHADIKSGNIKKIKIGNDIFLMTKRTYDTQIRIFDIINNGKNNSFNFNYHEISEFLDNKSNELLSKNISLKLTEEQIRFLHFLATSNDQFLAVQGDPGVGKTFTSNLAKEFFESKGCKVTGLSFVGKVVSTLKENGITNAKTIHSFLLSLENESLKNQNLENIELDFSNIKEKIDFNFEGLKPLNKKEVWLVDETSMIDNNLLYNLQKAALKRNAKIIFIGDKKQLNPIGPGYSFFSLINDNRINFISMTDNQRQKNAINEIQDLVKISSKDNVEINHKEEYLTILNSLKTKKLIKIIEDESQRINDISEKYSNIKKSYFTNSAVLTSTNKEKDLINEAIRTRLQEKNIISNENHLITTRIYNSDSSINEEIENEKQHPHSKKKSDYILQKKNFSIGDKIMLLKNDNFYNLQNGDIATITSISGNYMGIKMKEGNKYRNHIINLDQYNFFTHGYCYTTHKAQSSTLKNVIINHNSVHTKLNKKNSFFVNISRTSKNLHIYTDNFNMMVEQSLQKEFTPNVDEIEKIIDLQNYKINKLSSLNDSITKQLNLANTEFAGYTKSGSNDNLEKAKAYYLNFLKFTQSEFYKQRFSEDFIHLEISELSELFIPEKIRANVVKDFDMNININRHKVSFF